MSLLDTATTITSPATESRKVVKKQFALLKHKKQMLTILTLLFICVLGWVIVTLFASQQESKVDTKLSKLAQPLTPSLDLTTLDSLESKRSFSESELANFPIYRVYVDPRTREEKIISIDEPLPTSTPRAATPRPSATPAPVAP